MEKGTAIYDSLCVLYSFPLNYFTSRSWIALPEPQAVPTFSPTTRYSFLAESKMTGCSLEGTVERVRLQDIGQSGPGVNGPLVILL